jgi:hypothetical protein
VFFKGKEGTFFKNYLKKDRELFDLPTKCDKTLLFNTQRIKQPEWCYKRKNHSKYDAFDAF